MFMIECLRLSLQTLLDWVQEDSKFYEFMMEPYIPRPSTIRSQESAVLKDQLENMSAQMQQLQDKYTSYKKIAERKAAKQNSELSTSSKSVKNLTGM